MRLLTSIGVLFVSGSLAVAIEGGDLGYDPAADPARELQNAILQAQQDSKRILLVVGGEWCVWCKVLDDFLTKNGDVKTLWSENYVTLKIYFGPENENKTFLSQYPKITGYPYIFVLEADGSFLYAQSTGELEGGRSYSKKKMMQFLRKWAP